jgi:hypothetical protein
MVSKHPLFYASSISVLFFGTAIFIIGPSGLWFFDLVRIIALLIVATVFIFQMLLLGIRKRKIAYLQAASIVITSILVTSIYIDSLSTDVRFFLFRPYYEIQLARVQSGQNVAETRRDGNLVAFYLMRGGPDTWVGFVYDPTESLSLPKSKGIFNGTAYEIRQLNGRWFICYFS